MFCTTCGKKIKDDAAFCPFCGSQVGASSAPSMTEVANAQTQAGLDEQVRATRSRARRKMPMVLIVILVVLGLATAAFAANYIYQTFIVPQMEANAPDESVAPASTEAGTTAASTEAVTTAAAQDSNVFTTASFTGRLMSGDGQTVVQPNVAVPAFSFNVPDGWTVRNVESNDYSYSLELYNETTNFVITLRISLYKLSGVPAMAESVTKVGDSALGSDYEVVEGTSINMMSGNFLALNKVGDNSLWNCFEYAEGYIIDFNIPINPWLTQGGIYHDEVVSILSSFKVA